MFKHKNIWRGFACVMAALIFLGATAGVALETNRNMVDGFLGTKSYAVVTDSDGGELYSTFTADYENTDALVANAKAAIVASGTATLETAMIGTPQVVCYAGSELSYRIAKHLISGINYISLPNLIMDAPVVTELIQHDYNTERLEKELRLITENADCIAAMKAQYRELYTRLGDGSASRNAAEVVVNTAAR